MKPLAVFSKTLLLLLVCAVTALGAPRHSPDPSHAHPTHRSSSARREFMRETGYPHGRPGYVIDHVVALKRGGADSPSNMQWQTKAEAKAKDKWE